MRAILHSDMNSYYASVEMMLDPSLRGKAVAVCGSTETRHGIVLAKSELAKRAGVKTGMANWEAQQCCPNLITVPPHYEQYIKYSALAHEIYGRYTDLIEPFGMDECWLDVTESSKCGDPLSIAEEIRKTTKEELGLTVSIGVSFTKIFAKLGSDMKKPDAITCITEDSYQSQVWPLKASELLGVGPATTKKLALRGVNTIGDIARCDCGLLRSWLGVNGLKLWEYANGMDNARVSPYGYTPPVKSISHGITCIADLENNTEVKIFKNILPEYGMTERKEQIKLAHAMLDNMFDGGIALSDAGTGIGKTYAYLVAGVVFSKHRTASGEMGQPIVVSTATVALQKAVHDEYIPFLSKALLHAGYIDRPLLSVIRKGKSRYVCDKRLKKRLRSLDLKKKNRRNAEALLALKKCIDMDTQPDLSGYDRRQVAVPMSCRDCTVDCRYERFVEDCSSEKYLFQICNHNLLLADAMHTHCERHPILPNYCALIVDEAHKLPATARQMFGRTLGYDDILSLVNGLRSEHYPLAAQNLIAAMKPIAKGMTADTDEQAETFKREREKLLEQGLKTLNSIKRVLGGEFSRQVYLELTRMITTIDLFLDDESDIGKDGYPQILSRDELQAARNYKYREETEHRCPPSIQKLKNIMVCEECSAKLYRIFSKKRKKTPIVWQCWECGKRIPYQDEEFLDAIREAHSLFKQELSESKPGSSFHIPDSPKQGCWRTRSTGCSEVWIGITMKLGCSSCSGRHNGTRMPKTQKRIIPNGCACCWMNITLTAMTMNSQLRS